MTWLLNSCSNYEVLRLFSSRIARAMQLVGVEKRCASGPDHRCLPLNGDGERAAHHEKKLFMLVPMGWMGRTSRGKCRLVNLKVVAGVSHTLQDGPGFILPILLYRQLTQGLDEGSERRAI